MMKNDDDELFAVPGEEDRKIPRWLHLSFIIVILWGIWAFYAYWNGSHGWLDRGYWQKLQRAARTTYPFEKKHPALSEKRALDL